MIFHPLVSKLTLKRQFSLENQFIFYGIETATVCATLLIFKKHL